jgi:acetyl esterase/lipase
VETYTYKRVGSLEIKANVHRNAAAEGATNRPALMWIHSGGLIDGGRAEQLPFADAMSAANILVVSVDYRLAPETPLPGVIEDVEDAYRWICRQGPRLFGADPKRVAIAGSSAGGYLTLVIGYRAHARPAALVSLWGFSDLIGPWISEPSSHPRHLIIKATREDALLQVSGPPIANGSDRKGSTTAFYQYCRQHGFWPKAVSGCDPHSEPDSFYPYTPVINVTPDYPPTLLIHGEKDTDVPHEQSVMMAEELKKKGVEHELISVPGGEHGLTDVDPEVLESINRRAVDFLRCHLEAR